MIESEVEVVDFLGSVKFRGETAAMEAEVAVLSFLFVVAEEEN